MALYTKLQNLQRTGNKFADIQWVSETIEKILRQLEAQGEFIDEQRVLIQQIISKYPQEVIIKLEETKEPVIPWTVKSLRKAICHYVTVQENVQCYVFTNVKSQPVVPRHTRALTSALNDSPRPSTEVLTANSQKGSHQEGQVKASLPCIFCKGNHFNGMCNKFTTLRERKQILSQQRRCFICLKVEHMLKNCPSSQKKVCCHCGKKDHHSRCLCPQKFIRREIDTLLVTESGQSYSEKNTIPANSTDESTQPTTIINSNTTPMLLASGERVLLQIATVPVQSLDGSVTVTARVLLNRASQRTFMTDRLASESKLVSTHRELRCCQCLYLWSRESK